MRRGPFGTGTTRTVIVLGTDAKRVVGCLPQLKVFRPIVSFVTVLMVNTFMWFKSAPKNLLHYKAMLRNIALTIGARMFRSVEKDVTPPPDTPTLPVGAVFPSPPSLVSPDKRQWIPPEVSPSSTRALGKLGFLSTTAFTDTGGYFTRFRDNSITTFPVEFMGSMAMKELGGFLSVLVPRFRFNGSTTTTLTILSINHAYYLLKECTTENLNLQAKSSMFASY